MNILAIVPYTPNPIRVRSYQILRSLFRRGHQVTLAALWSTLEERIELQRLAAEGIRLLAWHLPRSRSVWNCLSTLPKRAPLQSAYCWQPAMAADLRRVLRDAYFDVIHVEHLRGARYGLLARRALMAERRGETTAALARTTIVWDSVDCISHLFAQAARRSSSLRGRLMTRLELERTRRYEGWLATQFDRVLVTSPVDRAALLDLSERPLPIVVLPNGVDLDYFRPVDEPREPATLVMTGKMSYHANVTAALHLVREVMPRVWAHRPDVDVWLVGKDPPREIRALASADEPRPGNGGPGRARPSLGGRVSVSASVPDIRPYLHRASLAVAPVPYGAGIQNKVLEAMACGTPVVASPQAASALQAVPGRDLVVGDDAEALARAVLTLLGNPFRRARVGRAGRAYVEAYHAWDVTAARLEQIYQAAGQAGARPGAGPILVPALALS